MLPAHLSSGCVLPVHPALPSAARQNGASRRRLAARDQVRRLPGPDPQAGRRGRLYIRNGSRFSRRFPRPVGVLRELPAKSAILDGEIVASDQRRRPSAAPTGPVDPTLRYALIAQSGVRPVKFGTTRPRGFRLPELPPATTEVPAAEETPVPEEAPMTEATPGISGCSRCGHTHSRYPGHTQDLGSHGSQGVCEDDGYNRQAPDQERSDLFHGLHHCEIERRQGVPKPIERSYPSIDRLLRKHLWLTSAAQDPRAPPYRIR